jgi:hypothetical protein
MYIYIAIQIHLATKDVTGRDEIWELPRDSGTPAETHAILQELATVP